MTTEVTRQAEVATTGWCQPKQLCDSRSRTEEWHNHLAENQAPGTPELQTAKVRLRNSQGIALPYLIQSCLEWAPDIEASVLQVCHTRVKHHRPHIGRTCATGNSAQRRFDLERYTCEGHNCGTNVFRDTSVASTTGCISRSLLGPLWQSMALAMSQVGKGTCSQGACVNHIAKTFVGIVKASVCRVARHTWLIHMRKVNLWPEE